ncbi:MAG: RagB/SusD family nutrient uptake outer membrane protein [Bacteroidales bacterium]|jgi:hypothetical protein|nr:RagB/SusD family nutrient uptake outer membrane protein [Bacteroidales bacterium]
MRNIYKIISLIILCSSLFACSDELLDKKPLDKFSEASVWQDLNLAQAFVNNQYKVLPKLGWNDWIRAFQLGCFTDEATHKYGYHGIYDYWGGIMGPSIPTGIEVWDYHYGFIKGCNEFLQKIDSYDPINEDEVNLKERMIGEIYALRAWSYMDLASRYGGVVLITEPFTLNDDFVRSRSTFEETVDLVLSDLNEAIDRLPDSYSNDDDWGRMTRGAALAIKSRMLLYAASPLFNPSNDITKWELAADAAKAVIDLEMYLLEDDFKQMFLTNKNQEIILSRGNDAIISDGAFDYFEVAEGLGGGIDGNDYNGGWSSTMVGQALVDDFEWDDGTSFDWDDPLDASDPYGIGENGQVDGNGNPIQKRDPRFYASITFDGSPWISDSLVQFWICEESNNYTLYPFDPAFTVSNTVYGRNSIGNPKRWGVAETGYSYRKSMDPYYNLDKEQFPRSTPWIIIRYAEILLNYAEASFEAGHEDIALEYIKKVRERVNMPPISGTGDELRQKIRHERRIELCLEGHHFHDARRWKTAHIDFDRPLVGVRIVKDKVTDTKVYNLFEYEQRTWPEKYYLQPIPQYELEKVSLQQNPGY